MSVYTYEVSSPSGQQVLNKKGKDLGQAVVPISLALRGDVNGTTLEDDEEDEDGEFAGYVDNSDDEEEKKDERHETRGKRMRFRLASGGAFKGWLTLNVYVRATPMTNS